MPISAKIRDWLLANDPALSRFRMAARVTLTVVATVACLALIHMAGLAMPPIAYGLAIILSIEGGVAVRDRLPEEQLKTRLIGGVASLACVGLAAALEDWRYVSDPMFLVIIAGATVGRVYGPRGFAVGMFAFTSYFMGAYLRPNLGDLPLAVIGPATAIATGHLVRTYLLPDDWRRDLLQSLVAIQGRVGDILMKLAALSAGKAWNDADRRALRQLEERLKDVVLMAEGFLPRPPDGAIEAEDEPLTALAMKIFDVHLAAESAIVLSLEALPPFVLVHALIENDQALAEKIAESPAVAGDERSAETARALIWLQKARTALADLVGEGRVTGFRTIERSAAAPPAAKPDFSLKNPVMRSAVQITIASSLAMVFGLMLSRDRWFWAVMTAFLIFTNTKSRGDTAIRALQRSTGTFLGIGIGLVVATFIGPQPLVSVPLIALSIFLGFYFLQVSYASMTFFISIVLCLIYGLTGTLTVDLLKLRIEETLIGAAAGTIVAFLVFPAPTRSTLDQALGRWYGGLKDLLSAVKEGRSGFEAIELSRKLDAAYRDVTVAARPLGTSWSIVTRPGQVRQTLGIFLGATYWARIFARNAVEAGQRPEGEVLAALEEILRNIEALAPRGSECFAVRRNLNRAAGRYLPIFKHGSRVGVEMIGTMLGRLYPAVA
ncbi:FUSC family protein [Rhizobium terrae]|uniref:FUSC family protein n=1 Tax=Rhizobium terrae TaxID=2171756 RepID=UPI000E3E03C1|nr:FUSC family protein [Rhizobium terrae]